MIQPNSLNWLKNKVNLVITYLVVLYLAAVITSNSIIFVDESVRAISLFLGLAVSYVVLKKFAFYPRSSPKNLVISLLIILLLVDPSASITLMFGVGVVTVLAKVIFRAIKRPVFNPAAAGIFIFSYFNLPVSWWGVSLSPTISTPQISAPLMLMIVMGIYLVYKYQKIGILVTALLGLSATYIFVGESLSASMVINGTFVFYLTIMACEPNTSPVTKIQKWLYGIILGSLLGYSIIEGIFALPYVTSLLVVNGIFSSYRYLAFVRMTSGNNTI